MKPRPQLQTQNAIAAHDLADAITASLSRIKVGPGDYSPELTTPEGPSTGGGVQSLQHLRLVPKSEGFPTLVVGSADHKAHRAELRSYDYVDRVHRERFKRPVPLDSVQYGEFLIMAKNLFSAMHLNPEIVGPPPFSVPPDSRKIQPIYVVAALVCVSLLIVVGFFVLYSRAH